MATEQEPEPPPPPDAMSWERPISRPPKLNDNTGALPFWVRPFAKPETERRAASRPMSVVLMQVSMPAVLLVHEPTQGVDVGARAQIFQRMRDAADEGLIVLYASAEWEDLSHLCERVLIFRHGRVVSELTGDQLTADRIGEQCFSGIHAITADAPARVSETDPSA